MGTADLAATALQKLNEARLGDIIAVVSQPDRPRGRDLQLHPTPVKQRAIELGLPILQPEKARSPEFLNRLRELQPSLVVVAAYGQLLTGALLEIPAFGCLNVHTSLLPKYRGAAPIQWAIANGESETGVTIMKMDVGLDTGPILTQRTTPITPQDTGQTLHDRLAVLGAELLVETIPHWFAGAIHPTNQIDEDSSPARKITKDDGRIDWSQSSQVIENRLRAFTPWPGNHTQFVDGSQLRLLKIHRASSLPDESGLPGHVLRVDRSGIVVACGIGALQITELQPESGRKMAAAEFLDSRQLSLFV